MTIGGLSFTTGGWLAVTVTETLASEYAPAESVTRRAKTAFVAEQFAEIVADTFPAASTASPATVTPLFVELLLPSIVITKELSTSSGSLTVASG
jgi:hypothetical protein